MLYDKQALSDGKGRLYYFDNAKFILIALVVLAHALSPLQPHSPFVKVLWSVINYFHMPAMVFISGFFAKRYISKTRQVKVQRVFTYLILYLAAQVSVALFERFVLGAAVVPSLMAARSSLWFLQCLVAWYVMLPVLDYFDPKAVMVVFTIFGLLIGYERGAANFLSISRVFVHLPFFMAGYYIKPARIASLSTRKYRAAGVAIFAAVTAVCAIWPQTAVGAIITCNTPYSSIPALAPMPPALRWAARLWFYLVAAALIAGFMALVPRGKAAFTALGKETLSVYILHRFLYLAHLKYKWYAPFAWPGGIAALSAIALAVTVVLSLKPFTLPFHGLMGIRVKLRPGAEATQSETAAEKIEAKTAKRA